ncbi:unnamed protein product (macronuclear) [Paramecium tetraurelia]|uniref:Chromosome undetermined scaffold_1, whole genome shotgun sequence n=1 Tax=Paramecium tetraurelia TaxID=5888 RepID=Q6BFQ0_PARTE|nr:hypothetical protein [Paramecium tetraurelia strain d4-2]XP_001423138.1 uncharacterized protein GSPATT00000175001 [Paramecium tetraurelia]CAH03520.1 hypothetical protein PTMB.322c [Paramecium tetraurelia]CAK55740.1 unnamed protein product [Paramecium tetraurelia]|eukprot:XP_001423138.1 hypothetical protein (macronuclear) [Paramecium tetraurelia strain d4-2]
MLSPEKDFILYNAQKPPNMQVPSFMTTASSFRNQKLSSLRNKSCATAVQDAKHISTIDYQICDKSEPINLKNAGYPKFKSEQSEISHIAKSQISTLITAPKIIQFIDFCNKKILDDELKKRKLSQDQTHKDFKLKINNLHENKKSMRHAQKHTRSNFTLPQMHYHEKQETQTIQDKINQNKIDTTSFNDSPVPKLNNKQPNFQAYTTKQPIRSFDMLFNVKHLVRLQEKRQKEFEVTQQNDPEFQLEMIKRQNQIQVLMSNTKKLEQLKTASKGILSHINQQDQQAEQIFQDFKQKLDLK